MAAASLTIQLEGNEIRKIGGNRRDIRQLHNQYQKMTAEEFNEKNPEVSINDYHKVTYTAKYNKK